jgi:hypothetical protein
MLMIRQKLVERTSDGAIRRAMRKPCSVPPFSPQISHPLNRARTGATAMQNQRYGRSYCRTKYIFRLLHI